MDTRAGEKMIRAAIRTRTFAPAYLLYGDDEFMKDELLRELIAAAVDPATRDFNLDVRRGPETSADTLGALLGAPPMMAERRTVVIRDVMLLKKEARKFLDLYLARPAIDNLLILVAPAGAKIDDALVAATAAADIPPLPGDKVPTWISYYAKTTLGTTVEDAAASLLMSSVGNDLRSLSVELDKLANYCNRRPIDVAAVEAVVGIQRDETLGGLLDAIARRDAAEALRLLQPVLSQPKTSGVTIVMALSVQFLAIAWVRAQRDRGVPMVRMTGDIMTMLKEAGGLFTGRAWGEGADRWKAASEWWSARELDRALEVLLAADRGFKSTRVSSDAQLLESIVLELCGAGARYAAA